MKRKKWMKAILVGLVATVSISAFAGCSGNKTPDTDMGAATEDIGNSGTQVANDVLEIPDELDFEGQDVTFLAWSDPECVEFEVKDFGGNTIENSIFTRNRRIEDELGINLNFNYTAGNVANVDNFVSKATVANGANTPYDILAAHTFSIASCAIHGLSLDLGSIDGSQNYLNTQKTWWNQQIVDACNLNGSFYFVTGDISTSFAQRIYCVYFNADKVASLSLESPYEMVANNTWTLENMISMCKNTFVDKNDNATPDIGTDFIPMNADVYAYPAFLHGCGIDYVTKDVDETGFIVGNMDSEKAIDIVDDLIDAVEVDGWMLEGIKNDVFKSQNLLFALVNSDYGVGLSGVSFEYGCVPCPKYDADQAEYISTVRQPISLFSVMDAVDPSRHSIITATLEMYAYQGYSYCTPVIFNEVMLYQTSASPEMTKMLELIRDTAYFNFGRIYATGSLNIVNAPGWSIAGGEPWSNFLNDTLPTYKNNLKIISDSYAMLAG